MVRFFGKSFRHGEKIRLPESAHKLTSDSKVTSRKVRLKSAKNLCSGHRFFDEIRQNPPILLCFQAKFTDSLQKSGALDPNLAGRRLFRKDDLLVACTTFSPGATCSVLLATRHTHLARPSARLMPCTEANKTTSLPAIFKQHLNKNFY